MNTGIQRNQKEIQDITNQIFGLMDKGFKGEEIWKKLGISADQFFIYRRKFSREVEKGTFPYNETLKFEKLKHPIAKYLNPIEFCERYLAIKPTPMQNLI